MKKEQKKRAGRPRHVAEYRSGEDAKRTFAEGMRALLKAKPAKSAAR